jgi:hypothetical protein
MPLFNFIMIGKIHHQQYSLFLSFLFTAVILCLSSTPPTQIIPNSTATGHHDHEQEQQQGNKKKLLLLVPVYSSHLNTTASLLHHQKQDNYHSSTTVRKFQLWNTTSTILGNRMSDDDYYKEEMNRTSSLMTLMTAFKKEWNKVIEIQFPTTIAMVEAMKNRTTIFEPPRQKQGIFFNATMTAAMKQRREESSLQNPANSTLMSSLFAYVCIFGCLSFVKRVIHDKKRYNSTTILRRGMNGKSCHYLEYEVPVSDLGGEDYSGCGVEYYGTFSSPWKSDLEKFDL